ncbi:hypothetical protein Dimus_018196, partial [Dionaea muscipula]
KFSYETNPWTSPHVNTDVWPRIAGGAWPSTATLSMHVAYLSELEHKGTAGNLQPPPADHHQGGGQLPSPLDTEDAASHPCMQPAAAPRRHQARAASRINGREASLCGQ